MKGLRTAGVGGEELREKACLNPFVKSGGKLGKSFYADSALFELSNTSRPLLLRSHARRGGAGGGGTESCWQRLTPAHFSLYSQGKERLRARV